MSEPAKRAVVTGGSGLIGSHLVGALLMEGYEVTVVSRRPERLALSSGVRAAGWKDLPSVLSGADVVFNLAGEGIAGGRWTRRRMALLRESRVGATEQLVAALGQVGDRPGALVNASAVGIYGAHGGEVLDETAPSGKGFLPDLCRAWEAAAERASPLGLRVVKARIGVVLSREGGALAKMTAPVKAFLGAPLGHGAQGLSWIHIEDLAALLVEAGRNEAYHGVLNATSPRPVTNRTFTRLLARTLHRPVFPVPAWMTRLGLHLLVGRMAQSLLLEGAFVYPRMAQRNGFRFRFERLEEALGDLLGRRA